MTPLDPTAARVAAGASLLGPLAFLVDNLLHPREVALGRAPEQLAVIAAAADRWQLAHAIGFVALPAGAVFTLALTRLLASSRAAFLAAAVALTGVCANAGILLLDGYTWGQLGATVATPGADPATLARALAAVQDDAWLYPYAAAAALMPLGLIPLASLARRAGLLSPPALATYTASLVGIALETSIHSNAYYVAVSVLYLASGVLVARDLTRDRTRAALG